MPSLPSLNGGETVLVIIFVFFCNFITDFWCPWSAQTGLTRTVPAIGVSQETQNIVMLFYRKMWIWRNADY